MGKHEHKHSSGAEGHKGEEGKHEITFSLLDITYPYHHQSMLSKSQFHGFECLLFECGIYFSLMYIVSNYINKGYLLQWDVLSTIANNFIEDVAVISSLVALAFLQIYLSTLLLRQLPAQRQATYVYGYCLAWLGLFVGSGLLAINTINFYFTDRIFIVVVSWALPVKTASYCIDQLSGPLEKERKRSGWAFLVFLAKYIVSPKVIYREFVGEHCGSLPIHWSYLTIKFCVAGSCLLINYILMTEIINPLIQPESYSAMSFVELFFRLIPVAFYVNVCLYYLIMENIMLAMSELTQLRSRVFYLDWWNAETVSEFLDKWVLLVNAFSDAYLSALPKRVRHFLNLSIIFLMLFSVFSDRVSV
jgi:hypothetical protein